MTASNNIDLNNKKDEKDNEQIDLAKKIQNLIIGDNNIDNEKNINNKFPFNNNPTSYYQNNTASQFTCTISKIDKGIAYLVSDDDIMFSLPVIFLPKLLQTGNSFQFNINETMKLQYKSNKLQKIHRKYIDNNTLKK